MTDFPALALASPRPGVVSTASLLVETGHAVISGVKNFNTAAAWPTANRSFAIPFCLDEADTPVSAAWQNGTITTAPNVDVGIYDVNLARLTSTGATLQAGATGIQTATFTSPPLLPVGMYYLAMGASGTGSLFDSTATPAIVLRACGCVQMDTAVALPSTFTPAVYASAYLPLVGATFASAL